MKLRQLIESFVIANDEFEDYLDRATEQLATEIQSGKNARDAVHDLSVQFSKMHNSAYAAYTRMSDSLFARLHTLELDSSESTDMMGDELGGDMSMEPDMGADLGGEPEMLNDPMGSGMEMDVPPAEDMPMDSEMDDYNAVMDNEPEMEESFNEGWETLKPIDKEKYQERPGLEGPFQTRVGKVVYYDPREGAYYDPDTDMYMSYEEWKELDGDSPLRNEAEEQFAGWLAFYNGKKLKIRKDQAKDIYNAKLKAIKHFNIPKSKQGVLAIKPAYEELNEAKQLNEFLPLLAPAAAALAPHLAGAAARAIGGALVRRGAAALAQRGATALASRGATGAARAVSTAVKGAKAASKVNTASNVSKAVNTASNVANAIKNRASSSNAPAAKKDYSTLQPSISKLNNSKYKK